MVQMFQHATLRFAVFFFLSFFLPLELIIIIIYPLTRGSLEYHKCFCNQFPPFSVYFAAPWDLANSRPVHSLMLSYHLFLWLPCLLPPFTVPCKTFWPDLMNGKHDHTTAVWVSLRWSGGLRVVRLPAGSWHSLPRW